MADDKSVTSRANTLYVIGLTTDGAFNSVHTSGRNRLISIIDVIRTAKQEA